MNSAAKHSSPRYARSLAEVITVLVLLGILLAVALPWMQRSREQSRRVQCQMNLKRIGEALQNYHIGNVFFPAGVVSSEVPVCNDSQGFDHNWISGIIGDLGFGELDGLLDRSSSVHADVNEPVLSTSIPMLRCPSLRDAQINLSCYAGNLGPEERPIGKDHDGIFYVDSFLREENIPDGLDYTVFVGEKMPLPVDAGWISGTRASLRNGGHPINATIDSAAITDCYVGGFGSAHVAGAYLMMGSGRWMFVGDDIDETMLRQMTARADSPDTDANAPSSTDRE